MKSRFFFLIARILWLVGMPTMSLRVHIAGLKARKHQPPIFYDALVHDHEAEEPKAAQLQDREP